MRFFPSRLAGLAIAGLSTLPVSSAHVQMVDPDAFYTLCTFYPQDSRCPPVHAHALKDTSPSATAVKDAFDHYARYLKQPSGGLTDEDRQYLRESGIRFPSDLSPANQAGLHNVIHDPALQKDEGARRAEVNNFISRAVSAELYCAFNSCNTTAITS